MPKNIDMYRAPLNLATIVNATLAAQCQWGDETFTAGPGTVTHCPPNLSHAMRVTSSESLRAFIVSWAPNGERSVWESDSVLLDQ